MSILRVKTTETRVGVVGLYSSGKTVLLTSLINHLQDYDAERFSLGGPATRVRKFTTLPPDPGWESFNYAGSRDALVHGGRWPAKTRDRSQYVCRFERSDWTFSDCLLKLYDLPGERVADAAMLGRDFAAWSDHLLGQFANDTAYRECCEPFLQASRIAEAATGTANEAELLHAYKMSLANLILRYKPLISPSTFLLDVKGQLARQGAAEELAASRSLGLGPEAEFCPLPAGCRKAHPEMNTRFASRYREYVEKIVEPTTLALKSCTSLIVMIDVTMLLAGGVGMYDDNRFILKDLLDVVAPGEHSLLGPLERGVSKVLLPHALRRKWITRLAFVAPKMDLVHPTDRDRLLALMKRMVERDAESRDGLKHEYFNLASVVSTRPLHAEGGKRLMSGVPLRDGEGRKIPPGPELRHEVSPLPDDWPISWRPGEYSFPEVYPQMPMRKDCPPEQVNVDKLASFVIE